MGAISRAITARFRDGATAGEASAFFNSLDDSIISSTARNCAVISAGSACAALEACTRPP